MAGRLHFFVLFLVIIVIGCAPMPVKIDVDKTYDFNKNKSYRIIPNEQDDLLNLGLEKTNIDKIVTKTIEEQLATKGYQKSLENPGFFVSYYLVTNAKTDVYFVDQYYTNLGYRSTPGRSSTRDSLKFQETTYEEGILIIDLIDASTNQRVWQGFLTSRVDVYKDEQKKERRLRNSIIKILSYLP